MNDAGQCTRIRNNMTMENKIQSKKRCMRGIVVSTKMQKTAVVRVDRVKSHPKYRKQYTVSKRYKAHDEKNAYSEGDMVIIEETRPISKDKRWRIVSKIVKK